MATVVFVTAVAAVGCGLATEGTFDDSVAGAAGEGGSAGGGGGGDGGAAGEGGSAGQGGSGGVDAGKPDGSVEAGGGGSTGDAGPFDATTEQEAATPTEDCQNGVDDDANGLADCADPACVPGFECVEAAPTGWAGYFRMRERAWSAAPAAPCPGGAPPVPLYAEPAGAPKCNACACGALSGVTCPTPAVSCWDKTGGCSDTWGDRHDFTAGLADGACHKPGFTDQWVVGREGSCKLMSGTDPTSTGSCPASGGALQEPAPWKREIDTCGDQVAGGGCGAGQVCVPRATAPYDSSVCITHPGELDCPGTWIGASVNAYAGADDTRSCSACTCTPKATCDVGYSFYDADTCDAPAGYDAPTRIHSGDCRDVGGLLDNGSWSMRLDPPVAGGTCATAGGVAAGKVTPKTPVTLCCR